MKQAVLGEFLRHWAFHIYKELHEQCLLKWARLEVNTILKQKNADSEVYKITFEQLRYEDLKEKLKDEAEKFYGVLKAITGTNNKGIEKIELYRLAQLASLQSYFKARHAWHGKCRDL